MFCDIKIFSLLSVLRNVTHL